MTNYFYRQIVIVGLFGISNVHLHANSIQIGVYDKSRCVKEHPLTIKGISELSKQKAEMLKTSRQLRETIQNNELKLRVINEKDLEDLKAKNLKLQSEYSKISDSIRAILAKQSGELHRTIIKDLKHKIKNIMKSKDLTLVLPIGDDMVFDKTIDITDIILKSYNEN
jgi:Skp family chaperone for outer membrane proteins